MTFKNEVILLFLIIATGKSLAQEKVESPDINIKATKISGKIIIDGELNENDWQNAEVIQSFKQVEPFQGKETKYDTKVKILFDNENLYIGVFATDSISSKNVRVQDLSRDFSIDDNDVFGIAIDTYNSKRNAVAFQITPYGTQRDLQSFDDTIFDVNWDAVWFSKTSITDSGWFAEIMIPFNSLSYPDTESNKEGNWGINFIRIRRSTNEISAFPGFPRSVDTYRMTYTALLSGIQLPKPTINISANPYLLQQSVLQNQNGESKTIYQTKIGGDIKWAISQHSTLNATFNTDFAQADVDKKIINLSRFNVNFPEKRQFFLENSGIFRTGDDENIEPFNSRNIGLDNQGNPVPIVAGLKFTDRTIKRTISGLYVMEDANINSNNRHFSIFRYLKNYGIANNLGFMFTNKYTNSDENNSTFSINGLNRIGEKWSFKYLVSQSLDNINQVKTIGTGGLLNLEYIANKLIFTTTHSLVSEKYSPGIGFISRENTIVNNSGIVPIIRSKWLPKYIRSYQPGVFFSSAQKASNLKPQESALSIFPIYFYFNNGGSLTLRWQLNWQFIEEDFNLFDATISKENYYYQRFRLKFNSDLSNKISVSVASEIGNYFNGKLTSLKGELKISPSPYVSFINSYELNHIRDLGNNKTSFNNNLYSSSLRLSLNSNVQLSSFYQYGNQQKNSRLNIRLSWQYRPLSFIYFVVNMNENKELGTFENNGIFKINFLKQFN